MVVVRQQWASLLESEASTEAVRVALKVGVATMMATLAMAVVTARMMVAVRVKWMVAVKETAIAVAPAMC